MLWCWLSCVNRWNVDPGCDDGYDCYVYGDGCACGGGYGYFQAVMYR